MTDTTDDNTKSKPGSKGNGSDGSSANTAHAGDYPSSKQCSLRFNHKPVCMNAVLQSVTHLPDTLLNDLSGDPIQKRKAWQVKVGATDHHMHG